jgi:hypothetical protein
MGSEQYLHDCAVGGQLAEVVHAGGTGVAAADRGSTAAVVRAGAEATAALTGLLPRGVDGVFQALTVVGVLDCADGAIHASRGRLGALAVETDGT